MKILVLTNFGMGLYKFRKELLEELVNQGYEVTVCLPRDEYTQKFIQIGCQFIEAKVDRRGTNPFNDGNLLLTYLKTIKMIDPDICFSYTIKPNIYGGIACRLLRIPFIPNVTGLGTSIENGGIMSKITLMLYRTALKSAQVTVFQNEANRDLLIKKNIVSGNTCVIPGSGVNLQEYVYEEYPLDVNEVRLLYIGRIMKSKGIEELLDAAQILSTTKNNIKIQIIGFCEEAYTERLNHLHDESIIEYIGPKADVKPYIKNAHAVILPSYHEGMSNVLLEAAATGRPVLASMIPGCTETFDNGITGLGFTPASSESIVEAILAFYKLTVEERQTMGKQARKKIETSFDRKIVINAYLEQVKKIERGKHGEFI